MDFNNKNKKSIAKWVISIATVCILIFLAVENIDVVAGAVSWVLNLVMPLLLGSAIAMVLNVPMRFFESHLFAKSQKSFFVKLRRPIAFILALIIIISVATGLIWLVIPKLVGAVEIVADGIITLVTDISKLKESDVDGIPFGHLLLDINWTSILESVQSLLKNHVANLGKTVIDTITSIINGVLDFFIAVVFAGYILFTKDRLKKQAKRIIRVWLPEKVSVWTIHAIAVANSSFRNFISGQTIEAVILGILCMIGMYILRLPFPPMIGALVGFTALVPVVGAFVGAIIGAFIILTEGGYINALVFLVFLIILQQIEEHLIYPRVIGTRVNLPAIWVLAAVTIGGGLYGAIGMLLSVPVASTIYVLFKEATLKKEKKPSLSDSL